MYLQHHFSGHSQDWEYCFVSKTNRHNGKNAERCLQIVLSYCSFPIWNFLNTAITPGWWSCHFWWHWSQGQRDCLWRRIWCFARGFPSPPCRLRRRRGSIDSDVFPITNTLGARSRHFKRGKGLICKKEASCQCSRVPFYEFARLFVEVTDAGTSYFWFGRWIVNETVQQFA